MLIVNTASQCGFTPQYQGLETLYKQYKDQGLVILGFPCNQFGGQEPGNADEIVTFCERNFDVTFPLLAKVEVNGPQAHPLFNWIKSEARGVLWSQSIKWNFTKFLIARDGRVVRRFASATSPKKLQQRIEKLLAESV